MEPLFYFDRQTKKVTQEHVYGGQILHLLYGDSWISRTLGASLAFCLARLPFISALYGFLQRSSWSARKVLPFIKKYQVDVNEFAADPSSFKSFNDFFIRHLKSEARPINQDKKRAIIPADGRYLFFQNIKKSDGFFVKGKKFTLSSLLGNRELASLYEEGSMVIARLCPTDYHRFHFPVDCQPSEVHLLNGFLYSVNPIALKKNIEIFSENERTLTVLESDQFGKVLFLDIGATFVGAIHQTYTPLKSYSKGDEKGYFAFGGSSLILLFPPNTICFDADLLAASANHQEIRCLMGESMGHRIASE